MLGMHWRLARKCASFGPLSVREPLFFVPPIREAVWWRIASDNDTGLRRIVERIALIANETNKRLQAPGTGTVVDLAAARRAESQPPHHNRRPR